MTAYLPYPGSTVTYLRKRLLVGFILVFLLYAIELLAVLYGRPSALIKSLPWLLAFVQALAAWVPVIAKLELCNAAADTGTGLMLSFSVVFFPLKLAALYYAFPSTVPSPELSWKEMWGGTWPSAAWNSFYALMIAIACLLPAVAVYGPLFDPAVPAPAELPRARARQIALCVGGERAFLAWLGYRALCLAAAFMSLRFFSGMARRLINRFAR
jgi:hypothetical protein